MYQMVIKYSKCQIHFVHMYVSAFSNLRPTNIYPNLDFWFENKPSGNPAVVERAKCNIVNGNIAICIIVLYCKL
jgi:hypothetical protein